MFKKIKILMVAIAFSFGVSAGSGLDVACKGDFFNPVADPNWNNFFPLVIFGKSWGGSNSDNPPLMMTSATCTCPSLLLRGASMIGLNIGYWRPFKIVDISKVPGCSVSLGGKIIFPGYEHNLGEDSGKEGASIKRNIQAWNYDVIGILGLFEAFLCGNFSGGIDISYDSNLDPSMNSMPTGMTGESEAVTFFVKTAGLLTQVPSILADTVASSVYHPLSFLPHLTGAQTPAYPFMNVTYSQPGTSYLNFKIVVDHLYKQSARMIEWATIGPTAQCFAHPSYFPLKSSYRFNRVYPYNDNSDRHLSMGTPLMLWDGATRNPPGQDDSTFLIWKAHQCCLKLIP